MPVAGAIFSNETANLGLTPPVRVGDVGQRGKQKVLRNTFTLASQAAASLLYLGRMPAACRFLKLDIVNSVSLGTATLAIGFTTPNYNDFLAAATFTAVDTPTHAGKSAAMAAAPFTADTDLYALTAVAALPAAGTLIIDVEYIDVG